MSNMHSRIMIMPPGMVPQDRDRSSDYMLGHRDASHSAAKIASEGDAIIAALLAALESAEEYISLHSQDNGIGLQDHDHDRYERFPLLVTLRAAIARAKKEAL